MVQAMKEEGIFSPGFHYRCVSSSWLQLLTNRDLNELRYSMRSVSEALPGIIDQVHLIVADRAIESVDEGTSIDSADTAILPGMRVVQTPHWLEEDLDSHLATNAIPRIQLAAHSDIFHLPSNGSDVEKEIERQWRQRALPSFNSKSIESRIGWVPKVVSDITAIPA